MYTFRLHKLFKFNQNLSEKYSLNLIAFQNNHRMVDNQSV